MTAPELVESFTSAMNQRAPGRRSVIVNFLSRTMQWLRDRSVTSVSVRRLRVRATVSLGEKRFVSILECDGQQFLIGGGTQSISLLASLSAGQPADTETRR